MKKTITLLIILFALCSAVWADAGAELIQAAKDGNLEQVRLLIATGVDINAKNEIGETPLTWAT